MMRWPTPLYRLPHFFISRIKMYGTSCERKDMKTNQIMIRPMGEFTVSQRTKDSYFDGGDLLRQWNSVKGNEQRKMDEFLLAKRTGDFIEALIAEERENGLGENSPKIDNQVVKKSKVKEKGKAGRPKEEARMHSFNVIAATFYEHYDEILNFYNHRSSNAMAESFNAKIKLFRANLRGVADKRFFLFRIAKLYAYPH